MAGTLPNIALIPQFDDNGDIMSGCLLSLWQPGSTVRVTAYKDIGLTVGQEHPWPIAADAAGRIPLFYLDDGDYRARLVSVDGSFIAFDLPIISTVGGSSVGGGEGGSGVSSEVIAQTGDVKTRMGSGSHPGWVRLNGRTIGSATSSATERSNADTQSLFTLLYASFSNAICPVSGGRGVSASADFAANKTITLPDWRGRALVGMDDMGNSAAGRITTGAGFASVTLLGATGGEDRHTLITSETPAHTHTAAFTQPTYDKTTAHALITQGGGASVDVFTAASGYTPTQTTGGAVATSSSVGGGAAHNNIQPSVLVSWYVKL